MKEKYLMKQVSPEFVHRRMETTQLLAATWHVGVMKHYRICHHKTERQSRFQRIVLLPAINNFSNYKLLHSFTYTQLTTAVGLQELWPSRRGRLLPNAELCFFRLIADCVTVESSKNELQAPSKSIQLGVSKLCERYQQFKKGNLYLWGKGDSLQE